jgi:hypothetical protein
MDEDEEDWTALLELFLPPPAGDPNGHEPLDDAPWRSALRDAARRARADPHTRVPSPVRTTRQRPSPGSPAEPDHDAARQHPTRRPRRGDRVAIISLAGVRGRVLALDDEWALVETEAARVRVRCAELVILIGGADKGARAQRPTLIRQRCDDRRGRRLTVRGDGRGRLRWHAIDLHGLMPAEALAQLDDFLFASWQEGRQTVAVVHGKGAGTLRTAVRALLAAHPAVHHTVGAPAASGGDGVTVVQLRRKSDLFDDRTDPGGR